MLLPLGNQWRFPKVSFSHRIRWLSSRRNNFQLDALPFSISASNALEKFYSWAHHHQGLEYLIQRNVKISAVYTPVWNFELNIKFFDMAGNKTSANPKPFDIYTTDTIHFPGWAVYSGYNYRRSLIDPVHRTTLLYMGDLTTSFNSSTMLKGLDFNSGRLDVFPDPWNATKASASRVVEEELGKIAQSNKPRLQAEFEILNFRRVYMPTFVIEYKVFNLVFEAFVSGCDPHSPVSGVSHATFSKDFASSTQQASSFINKTLSSDLFRHILSRNRLEGLTAVVLTFVNVFLKGAIKFMARFHIFGILGSAGIVTFRKLIKPWMDSRTATAEWERQRQHEAQMHERVERDYTSHFRDDGSAKRYFYQNKSRILKHLRGEKDEAESIYSQWWQYVKRQAQEQHQSHQRTTTGDRQQRRKEKQESSEHTPREETNIQDPHTILNIKKDATMAEISQAFRREMLKNHPDTKPNASAKERMLLTERSKIITDAYRKLKAIAKTD